MYSINHMDLLRQQQLMHQTADFFRQQADTLQCKISLMNEELWDSFHEHETEMIITKSGRRMFPAVRVKLENLDPNENYCVYVEMCPVSKNRYKYTASGGWAPAGAEESQSLNRMYVHPMSPAVGSQWMTQIVSFGRLKLTNCTNPPLENLTLSSMHKYEPRIIVAKTRDPMHLRWSPRTSAVFVQTRFVAVTAYQNDKITQLKIDHNPFAKGFRDNGQSKCKRKRVPSNSNVESPKRKTSEESSTIIDITSSVTDRERASSPESVASISSSSSSTSSTPPGNDNPYPQVPVPIRAQPVNLYPQYQQMYAYPQHSIYSSRPIIPIPINPHPSYIYHPYTILPAPIVPPKVTIVETPQPQPPKKLTDFSIKSIIPGLL